MARAAYRGTLGSSTKEDVMSESDGQHRAAGEPRAERQRGRRQMTGSSKMRFGVPFAPPFFVDDAAE